jgi:hypothetical protein
MCHQVWQLQFFLKDLCSSSYPLQQPWVSVSLLDCCNSFLPGFHFVSSVARALYMLQPEGSFRGTNMIMALPYLKLWVDLSIKVQFNFHAAQAV